MQWAYTRVERESAKAVAERLKALGMEEWELVSAYSVAKSNGTEEHVAFLKRPSSQGQLSGELKGGQ